MRMPDNNLSEQDWQSFELTDALILNKDGKTIENALDVILNGPFIVRGRLMVETDEQRTQRKPPLPYPYTVPQYRDTDSFCSHIQSQTLWQAPRNLQLPGLLYWGSRT